MQFKQLYYCAIGLTLLLAAPAPAQWTSVGTGIDYQYFRTSHPNDVYVARMLRTETNAYLESSIAMGTSSGAREIVTSQADRNNDAIGYWGQTWGNRNDVVIAINGSFFDLNTGIATCGMVHSGWYCKRFCDVGGPYSGMVWELNRSVFLGGCVTHPAPKNIITYVTDGGATQQFQDINVAPGANQITIFTPQYNTTTGTDNTVTEVLVDMSTPARLIPTPSMCTGTIKQIRQNAGSTPMQFDQVVLSATGSAATTLLSYATVGDTIGISQEIRDLDTACNASTGQDWSNTYGMVAGNFVFLRNSVNQTTTDPGMTARNPRTAIGYNANYVYFFVCDGRTSQSVGMTSTEMSTFFVNTLGATDAVNQDGGGSSTMVVNGTLMNNPSDGSQRAVSNGMMMCNLVAKSQSTTFTANQNVSTTGTANVRYGPGTDYAVITSVNSGTSGTIVDHALKGVYAKGSYWWKVTFPSTVGWVAESLLSGGGGCTSPSITVQPSNQSVTTGGTAVFTVTASGTAPLSYQWQKNDVNVTNGGHDSGCTTATLTITNCDSSDAANYRCVVTNACGNVTSNEASLTVNPPASTFIVESRSGGQNYANYSETGLWSSVSGKSTAPGCTAGIGQRYCTIGTTAVTAVFSFTPTASGTYEVFTTNVPTTNSGNPLVHKVTHAGGTANVNVCQNSTCNPNPCNVWYSLGQYTLNSGTQYTVTLDGSTGAGSSPSGNAGRSDAIKWAAVSVGGPTITQQPAAQNVCTGSNPTFTVAATGQGTLTYQWQKNDVNVTNGGHYSGCTTATLTVTGASSADAANYRCVVTDNTGSTNSNEAALTLKAATAITQQPSAQNVCPGSNPTFTVAATGDGTLTYQWQKNDANLTNGGHYSGCTTATLTVSGASSADAANYRCVVTGGCGSLNSNEAALSVRAATTITQQPSAQNVCPGSNPTFTVTATGDGTLTYQWQKNDVNVTNGGHYSGCTTATLTVTGASSADAANYRCVVTGGCGSANSNEAALSVKAATTITTQPQNQSVSNGGTAVFTVAATGDGTLTYQWQKNSVNVTNGGHYSGCTTATLTITNCDSSDAASYCCVVTGGCGSATSNQATLTIQSVQTILSDNFDSYANQAAFVAAWPATATSLTLSTTQYHSSPKSVYSAASSSIAYGNKKTFTENYGTDTSPLTLQFWLYDNGGATSYQWVELRDYAPATKQLIQFGVYSGQSTTYYSARVTYSPGAGWFTLNGGGAPARSVGWHLFKAVFKSTTADFYVDNVLAASGKAYSSSQGNVSFEEIRVGSGYASTSGAAYYDDVLLQKGQ